MRILTRYLVARFLGFFAALLVISITTLAIVEMLLNLGDVLAEDGRGGSIATYLLLRVPSYYLRDLVPVVAFAASFATLGVASRWLEVTAMKAGGVSPHRISLPLIATGAGLTLATFLLNETIVLDATRQWNRRGSEEGVPIAYRRGSFWYHRGRTIYKIAEADRETRTLRGVRIYELGPRGQLVRSIEAAKATIEGENRWRFEAPTVRSFDPDRPESAPHAERHREAVLIDLADQTDLALMNADPTTLGLADLREAIAHRESVGRRSARLQTLLHGRLSEPVTVMLFVLAAIPLGARVESARSIVLPALYGIITVAAFYGLRSLASTLSSEGLVPAQTMIWSLMACFAAYATWRWTKMTS